MYRQHGGNLKSLFVFARRDIQELMVEYVREEIEAGLYETISPARINSLHSPYPTVIQNPFRTLYKHAYLYPHLGNLEETATFEKCAHMNENDEAFSQDKMRSTLRTFYRDNDGDLSQLVALSGADVTQERLQLIQTDIKNGILVDTANFQEVSPFTHT